MEMPADVVGIEKYLGSGLIKGIGPKYAKRIVELFGHETLEIIEKAPERLCEVEGIGSKRLGLITGCWADQKAIREVMVFLQAHGVSPGYAQKIFKAYGSASIKIVKENPFRLAQDIFGIGFKSADTIAQKLGIPHDAPQRVEAGIEFVLAQLSNEGHVCYPVEELLVEAENILAVPKEAITASIESLRRENRVMVEELFEQGVPRPFIWIRAL
jgi:exodeoxyribonuclease V alpha subunit